MTTETEKKETKVENPVAKRIEDMHIFRGEWILTPLGLNLVDTYLHHPEKRSENYSPVLIQRKDYSPDVFYIKIDWDSKTYPTTKLKFTLNPGVSQLGDKKRSHVYALAASYCDPNEWPMFEKHPALDNYYEEEFRSFLEDIYHRSSPLLELADSYGRKYHSALHDLEH